MIIYILDITSKGGDFVDGLNKKYLEFDILSDNSLVNNKFNNSNIIDNEYQENCINCFYSDEHYCSIKNKHINFATPICWCYRDCFTMRASSDFQDDNEDFYEYDEY